MHFSVRTALVCLLLIGPYRVASALVVEVAGSSGMNPPLVTNGLGSSASFSVTVRLKNETAMPVDVSLWQLKLELSGKASASGEVHFVDVHDPPEPFLRSPGDPAISPQPRQSEAQFVVLDADQSEQPSLPGKTLAAGASQDIAILEMEGMSATAGTFRLLLGEGGSGLSTTGSLFITNDFPPSAMAFSNASNSPHGIVLAEIAWENADFNQDGQIGGVDFLRWQRGFSHTLPFGNGDSNGDSLVDDLDLAVWQLQYGAESQVGAVSLIPEPRASALAAIMLAFLSSGQASRWRRLFTDQ